MALWTGFPAGTGKTAIPEVLEDKIVLRCRARSDDFQRKLSINFTLSDLVCPLTCARISDHPTHSPQMLTANTNPQLDSLLLQNLPTEIINLLFTTLACAPSQVSLALTCKLLANLASTTRLALSTTSRKYAGFLPVSVFDVPLLMKSLVTWVPTTLRLCNHCLTFRPRSQGYWDDVSGCEVSNFWIQKTGWTFSAGSWHKVVHDICPSCHGSCSLSDYVDCDGCRALGRLGDVDWTRISDSWRRRTESN